MPKQRNDGLVAKRVLFSIPYFLILAFNMPKSILDPGA